MSRYDVATNAVPQGLVSLGAVVLLATSAIVGGVVQASGFLELGTLARSIRALAGDATSLALVATAGGAALWAVIGGIVAEVQSLRMSLRQAGLEDTRYVPVQTRVMLQPSLQAARTGTAEERVLLAA